MECAAWAAYQRARAPMLSEPPEGQRQVAPPHFDIDNLVAQVGAPMPRKGAPQPPPDQPVKRQDVQKLEEKVAQDQKTLRDIMTQEAKVPVGGSLPGSGGITLPETDILAAAPGWGPAANDVRSHIRTKLVGMGYRNVEVETKLRLDWQVTNPAGSANQNRIANVRFNYVVQVQVTAVDPAGRPFRLTIGAGDGTLEVSVQGLTGANFNPNVRRTR